MSDGLPKILFHDHEEIDCLFSSFFEWLEATLLRSDSTKARTFRTSWEAFAIVLLFWIVEASKQEGYDAK